MKVQCPACRKVAQLPESEAGLVTVCLACGKTFPVPALSGIAKEKPAVPEVATASEAPAPPPVDTSSGRTVAAFWSIVGVACSVALFLIVWGVVQWGAARRAERVAKINPPPAVKPAPTRFASQQVPAARPTRTASKVIATAEPSFAWARSPTTRPSAPALASKTLPPAPADSGKVPAPPRPRMVPVELPATMPARPSVRPVQFESDDLTDKQIGEAIRKGADYLLKRFDPKTHLLKVDPRQAGLSVTMVNGRRVATLVAPPEIVGEDILLVYALLQCGESIDDPRLNLHESPMKEMVAAMKALPLNDYHYETYARGLRATALALHNRPEDRNVLKMDATALVKGSHGGAYTYSDTPAPGRGTFDLEGMWDNSNSQYGLLGVWSAVEAGFEVSDLYWAQVQKHWTQTQCANGQWSYHMPMGSGTHSMTCAGLASLLVTYDYLEAPKYAGNIGREPFSPALRRGLAWLEQGNNCLNLNHAGYSLYGLERVGLASGFKYFGDHDWYRELAGQSLIGQAPNGSWGSDIETAYNLLFLARGRHPILMNKLRFTGYWANRPRDTANLARFASHQLERPLNWQVVPLKRDWTDWMDSPILYLASHEAVKLSDDDISRIRSFVQNGGLLFTQGDGDSFAFNTFAVQLAHRLFPDYEMADLPATHPLCSMMYKIKPDPPLKYVTNGSRILMLHSNTDLAKFWQLRDDKHMPYPFEFGTNLFIYAAGKRDLRNRLESPYIPPVKAQPIATFKVARLTYPGNWNPEPAAWTRFSRWLQLKTGYGIDVIDCPMRELKPQTAPLAHLTGTAAYSPTASEVAAIKRYVESGGVLLVDLCGGTGTFDKQLQSDLFRKAFPGVRSQVLSSAHPLLNAGPAGMEDLSEPRLRQFATETLGTRGYFPEEIAAGRGHVIFSALDLTTGLLGTRTWGILGYDPDYAQSLLKNLILWTWDGQHDRDDFARSQP